MTHSPQADQRQAAGSHVSPLRAGQSPDPGRDSDAGALGQAIASRLFRVGFDLHFALALTSDGPAAQRLHHAVDELDEAIKDLRHLMLTMLAPAVGAAPDSTGAGMPSPRPAQVTNLRRTRP